jgi:trehalose 6-phosphate synthase
MSIGERRERWQQMVTKLRRAPVRSWFTDFLHTLAEVRRAPALPTDLRLVLDGARMTAQQRGR